MRKFIRPSTILVFLLGSFVTRIAAAQLESPAAPNATAVVAEIPASIRAKLSSLPLAEFPWLRLKKLQSTMSLGSKNLLLENAYEQLENGLLGVSSVVNTGNSNQLTRMLTLRGLIELAGTTDSTMKTSTLFQFRYTSFTVNSVMEAGSIYTTTALSGDLAALLSPKEGTQFSYVHSWAVKRVTSTFLVSSKKTIDNIFTVTCSVGSQLDASTLFDQLQGKYMPVVCDGKNREGTAFSHRYAYLVDSQIYVHLSELGTFTNVTYKLIGVEYFL